MDKSALTAPNIEIDGRRLEVPIDQAAVAEFTRLFAKLTVRQQDWLIIRFLGDCETDEEATGLLNRRQASLADKGDKTLHDPKFVSVETAKKWKSNQPNFKRAYDLMASRLVKWAEALVLDIERGNAVLGAIEARKLLQVPWTELDSRGKTAKEHAIQSSLDRVVGKKERIQGEIRVEDLIPRE